MSMMVSPGRRRVLERQRELDTAGTAGAFPADHSEASFTIALRPDEIFEILAKHIPDRFENVAACQHVPVRHDEKF